MISDDRHVMAVCWFRRVDMRVEWERNFDREYYWFEVQILLTTLLTIFLPISLIVACNIRVLTIGKLIDSFIVIDFICYRFPWDFYDKHWAIHVRCHRIEFLWTSNLSLIPLISTIDSFILMLLEFIRKQTLLAWLVYHWTSWMKTNVKIDGS